MLNAIGVVASMIVANAASPRVLVAILVTVGLSAALRAALRSRISLNGWGDCAAAVAASMLWHVVIFVPVHYVTQGYLTSFGNISAAWPLQLAANSLAVCAWQVRVPQPE